MRAIVLLLASILPSTVIQPLRQPINHPVMAVASYSAVTTCSKMTQPETMDTPHPLLPSHSAIVVDFVVGYDGLVYSPIVLESSLSVKQEREVLKVVSTWRFHPAICDEVETGVEGRVTLFRQ